MSASRSVIVCDVGHVEYQAAWDLQRAIQTRLIQAKRSDPPEIIAHVLLLVEHDPVYTLGKSGRVEHLSRARPRAPHARCDLREDRSWWRHHVSRPRTDRGVSHPGPRPVLHGHTPLPTHAGNHDHPDLRRARTACREPPSRVAPASGSSRTRGDPNERYAPWAYGAAAG